MNKNLLSWHTLSLVVSICEHCVHEEEVICIIEIESHSIKIGLAVGTRTSEGLVSDSVGRNRTYILQQGLQAKEPPMCKILIVEDEEDLINIIGTVLTDEGYSVKKASSAEEALLACQSVPPDLIISDVRMGVLSGFDLLERIKTNGFLKNTPFVFLTSLDEAQARIKALGLGAAAYITKPFDLDDLFETIRKFAPL